GHLLAAGGSRHGALWNVQTGRLVRVLAVGGHGASSVAFSSDGRTLAVGTNDGVNVLYDARTGRKKAELGSAGPPSIQDVDFSPDGRLLASARLDGSTVVWDVKSEVALLSLKGESAADFAVRFSPDGKLIAVGDISGPVVLWDARTGRRDGQPLGGGNVGVNSIAFDASGSTLATSSGDGKI